MKQYSLAVAILAACATLAACGKQGADTPDASAGKPAPTGMIAEAARQAEAQAKIAALPKPDMARPLTDYAKLDGGEQLMFLYLAAARLPPDYAAIASEFSSDYRDTSDTFRKQDLLTALMPQIDARIGAAVQQPYAWMEVKASDNLAGYDFQRGGFPVQEFQQEMTRYFNDAHSYRLTWANREALMFATVKDEAVAREIEGMRNEYNNNPRLKVYFFAQAVDLDSKHVKAYVTRVQITDRSGRVLAEYGPDASAATVTASPAAEQSDAAAAFSAAAAAGY